MLRMPLNNKINMRILKFTLAAVFALLMTSCLTNAILSTVLVDKKLIKMRAGGDTEVVNVKCAVSVHAKASESWIHLSATSFGTNLGDGYDLVITTDASTSTSMTSGYVRIYIDDESYADVKVERDGRNDSEVRDIEGHSYGVARINGKYWMTENLRCLTYDTESELYGKKVTLTENGIGFTGRACVDPSKMSDLGTMESYKNSMGYLYNWIGAMGLTADEAISMKEEGEYDGRKRQGICPNGFRLPTYSELSSLASFADGQAGMGKGGKFLKTTVGWDSSKGNGTDGCGFHAYPCGVYKNGAYNSKPGFRTSFWASTSKKTVSDPGTHKCCMGLPSVGGKDDVVTETGHYENEGMSVRCVRK